MERRFQVLALEVSIATNCPRLDRQLDYLVQDAAQDFSVSARVRYEAIRQGQEYRICEDFRDSGDEHHRWCPSVPERYDRTAGNYSPCLDRDAEEARAGTAPGLPAGTPDVHPHRQARRGPGPNPTGTNCSPATG